MNKCENCGNELTVLNPLVEVYLGYTFWFKLFGWKLMLRKDRIDYGCIFCQQNAMDRKDKDLYEAGVQAGRQQVREEEEIGLW